MEKVNIRDLNSDQVRIYAAQQSEILDKDISGCRDELAGTLYKIYRDGDAAKHIIGQAEQAFEGAGPYPRLVDKIRSEPDEYGAIKGTYLGILPPGTLQERTLAASDQMRRMIDLGRTQAYYRNISNRAATMSRVPANERDAELDRLRDSLETADVARHSRDVEDRVERAKHRESPVIERSRDPDVRDWFGVGPDR